MLNETKIKLIGFPFNNKKTNSIKINITKKMFGIKKYNIS